MIDEQKFKMIDRILNERYDWVETYRQNLDIPSGHGIGVIGSEAQLRLIRKVLDGEPVTLIYYND